MSFLSFISFHHLIPIFINTSFSIFSLYTKSLMVREYINCVRVYTISRMTWDKRNFYIQNHFLNRSKSIGLSVINHALDRTTFSTTSHIILNKRLYLLYRVVLECFYTLWNGNFYFHFSKKFHYNAHVSDNTVWYPEEDTTVLLGNRIYYWS